MTIVDDIFESEYRSKLWKKYYAVPENAELERKRAKDNYSSLKDTVKIILGSKCAMCEFAEFEFLEIDHKNSDGGQQRRLFKGHKSEWRYYRDRPIEAKEKLQLLCPLCHRKKEKNEAPYGSSKPR